jgi:hypothetical protein
VEEALEDVSAAVVAGFDSLALLSEAAPLSLVIVARSPLRLSVT